MPERISDGGQLKQTFAQLITALETGNIQTYTFVPPFQKNTSKNWTELKHRAETYFRQKYIF